MTQTLTFRAARPEDSSDIAVLFDAASRRVCSWYWGTIAEPGQSWSEVRRSRIRDQNALKSHHLNWQIAEFAGQTAGAFFGFSLPDPAEVEDLATLPPVLHPMVEMEATAKGCWLLQAVAHFPEHRGKGLGPALIERACAAAWDAGHQRIVLQVETCNPGAYGLYRKCRFTEWERRPYVPFPGSDDSGEWVLMVRDL